MSELKKELIQEAGSYVEERLQRIHAAIDDLKAALKLETKCSMGDKYETGRAMLHLEFEKLSGQLEQYGKLKKTLNSIPAKAQEKVGFGSLVKTSGANYFIAIPAGELKTNSGKFYAVGANSPVAIALKDKRAGEDFTLNGQTHTILSVE
ncbi:transcription elongation factor [Salegentibacter sediminis]|uniref:transcription elongation factor n=1 Tax=Salegentibacter sediminis TaxID=1930251 RepID=UPI001E2EAD81|nr:transcription elongation factor [Salegentibacter sediminis]